MVHKTFQSWIENFDQTGKLSWLCVKVNESSINPFRDKFGRPMSFAPKGFVPEPMRRLMFQVDGFTTIDFEVQEKTSASSTANVQLRVICNQTLLQEEIRHGYHEDAAWTDLPNNSIITCEELLERIVKFCNLSNNRPTFC